MEITPGMAKVRSGGNLRFVCEVCAGRLLWWPALLFIGLLLALWAPPAAWGSGPAPRALDAPLPLARYPRPPGDNGWGVHFSPAAARLEPQVIDYFVPELRSMGMRWTVLLNDGLTPQQGELVDRLVAAGIEPIVRIYTPNEPLDPDALRRLVAFYVARGVHYFQLYNEPNLAGEPGGWKPGEPISVARMVDLWVPAARAVREAGGYPSTPPLAPGGDYDDLQFWREFLDLIKQRGQEDVFYGAWINVHNYGLNHPFDYPEEPINLLGRPVTPEELAFYGLSPDQVNVEELNFWRAVDRSPNRPDGGKHKGDTILEDSNGFRKFEAYHQEFVRRFGFEIPVIVTEGGWIIGDAQDKRYPPVTVEAQTRWLLMAYEYMLDRAPDYLFAFNPWIVANYAANGVTPWFEPHAWYKRRCSPDPGRLLNVRGETLPPCGDGDLLPIVYALKAHPRKAEARPRPAERSPVVAASRPVRPTPPPRVESGLMRFDLETWDAVATLAATLELSPAEVLARLYPDTEFGEPTLEVASFQVRSPDQAIQVEVEGETVRLVNVTDRAVTVSVLGQVYQIAPRGSLVALLPRVQYVVVPTKRTVPASAPTSPTPTPPSTSLRVESPSPSPTPEPNGWPDIPPNAPWEGQWVPGRGRTPTATWSPADVWPLERWPRPPGDTGLGLHYVPVGYVRPDGADVETFIADLQAMHMTWATVLYADEKALQVAAPRFRRANIMVLWRPVLRPYERYIYAERDIRLLEEAGMPPYIQLYNEPDVLSEWREEDWRLSAEERDAVFIDNWIAAADEVWQRGGFPGLQVTSPDLLRKVLRALRERGKLYILNHTFFVPHPYGSNHPPDYPYDPVNQAERPGITVEDDWTTVLGFLKYARVFQEEVGFVPPMIAGEGGWTVSTLEDDRYPRITPELHRVYHLAVAEWFRSGRLSNGEPLPDYLFAFTFWLYKDAGRLQFADSAWFDSPLSGTKRATIEAFAAMSPFTRRFSWTP